MKNSSTKSILLFLSSRFNQLILILAILGIFLALQGKQPTTIDQHNPRFLELAGHRSRAGTADQAPIHLYQGLLEIRLNHSPVKNDINIKITSGEFSITDIKLPSGKKGKSSFLIYPGSFNAEAGLTLSLSNNMSSKPLQAIESVEFIFPKTGTWLVPDLMLWTFISLITLFFGMICSLVWKSQVNILASFGATVLTLIVVLQFGGLEIAQRIGDQLFAVIFLLIIVFLIRLFVIKPGKVEIQE